MGKLDADSVAHEVAFMVFCYTLLCSFTIIEFLQALSLRHIIRITEGDLRRSHILLCKRNDTSGLREIA